ncbi:MAG: alpha-amylase, partial [Saprospiraceae bacterium]
DLPKGNKVLPVFDVFPEGTTVRDYYSGTTAKVQSGAVNLDTVFDLVLLGEVKD